MNIIMGTSGTEKLRITYDGKVGIGTSTPQAKLAVNGDVFATKIKVTQTGWPDYVFHHNYNLPSLPEVEMFIKNNQHLPDIPSAAEVDKNGLDLGEMNKKLLQKVEELTLYIIEQQKTITDLQQRMKAIETTCR